MTAREDFERLRRDMARLEELAARMEALSDGMGAVAADGMPHAHDARPVTEEAAVERMDSDTAAEVDAIGQEMAERARQVAGVRAGLGERYARALELRYFQGLPWAEVAKAQRCTRQWSVRLASVALDWLDAFGPTASSGMGEAEA